MTKIKEAYEAGKEVYDKTVPSEDEMKRPTLVTVIAILFILLAILSLLWSGLVFGVGGLSALVGNLFGAQTIQEFGASSGWSGFVGILAAGVQIAVGVGLLYMKRWSWWLALVAVALTVVEGFAGMFSGGPFALMCGLMGLAVPIAVLVYLLLPGTRKAFGIQIGQ
jgi:hypothetical protein